VHQTPINSIYAQEWMRNDISCYASSPNGAQFFHNHLKGTGTVSSWSSQEACTFLNHYTLTQQEIENR